MDDTEQLASEQKQGSGSDSVNSPILKRPIILGDLTLASPTTQTTVGAAGGASAQPATPLGYLLVQIGNATVAIPYHNAS